MAFWHIYIYVCEGARQQYPIPGFQRAEPVHAIAVFIHLLMQA